MLLLLVYTLCLIAPIGYSHRPGPKGEPGLMGFSGPKGEPGLPGLPGPIGEHGLPGHPGPAGKNGLIGLPGLQGDRGFTGEQGVPGYPGRTGQKGEPGSTGFTGSEGEPGWTGFTGSKGDRGFTGEQGMPGNDGPKGDPGQPGPTGPAGYCEQDTCDTDHKAIIDRISKFELAINYDFVRKVGQKYFVSYKERASFSKAIEFCSEQGLELALPQNEQENKALTEVFGDVYKEVWINVNNKKAAGDFEVDMKGRPLTFTKWENGQPDTSIQDTACTRLSDKGWQLTDECFQNAFIICQI